MTCTYTPRGSAHRVRRLDGTERDPHVGLVYEPGSDSVESEEVRCRRGCAVDHGDYVASRIGEPNPVAEPPKMSKSFVSSLAGQAEECFTETSIPSPCSIPRNCRKYHEFVVSTPELACDTRSGQLYRRRV